MRAVSQHLLRLVALLALSLLALQLCFALRIALMLVIDPQSTTFQRSEAWRLLMQQQRLLWSQEWVGYERISPNLKRAVIASEDAAFVDHNGVDWEAMEKAWEKNVRAQARAERINERLTQRQSVRASTPPKPPRQVVPKVIGGSTITQQLAKNLFLDSERSLARKGQEFLITFMLEAICPKQRILEIYLNNVEWGEGLFGAQAAARHYFHVDAAKLGPYPAARLAVMLPAPKRFEKRPDSPYVSGRAGTIVARMAAVDLP